MIMNQEPNSSDASSDQDKLQPEYDFDYSKARPNRFATQSRLADGSLVVVLEPDIAQVFTTPESVKAILRALIQNLPPSNDKAA